MRSMRCLQCVLGRQGGATSPTLQSAFHSAPSAPRDGALSVSLATASRGTRVAVLGGSFDPITDGHLKCACEIVHARKADEVWIVPCGVRPDKPSLKTPFLHRLTMCHLAVNTSFGSSFPIRVCDIEMEERCALSCWHLMQRLSAEYPDKEFRFVIGADLIADLKSWDAPGVENAGERLYRECRFLVMDRPGYLIPADLPPNFIRLTAAEGTTIVTQEVSSSEMRKRMRMQHVHQFGDDERANMLQGNFTMVDGLLTPAVLAHIMRYRLYSVQA